MKSNRVRIVNALVDRANAGPFYQIKHSAQTAKQDEVDTVTDPAVQPAGIICNETSIQLQPNEDDGRQVSQEISEWQFVLILEFQHETSIEEFIRSITKPVIKLPRSGDYPDFAIIRLQSAQIEHPTHKNPSTGTRATLTFSAFIG